tara:strand:+ start:13321 stop:13506 length:186 start_codon:yes stop_codon:yes gene_type:complete
MYEILAWDSEFFKFTLPKIGLHSINDAILSKILSELKNKGVKLAYLSCDPECIASNSAANK